MKTQDTGNNESIVRGIGNNHNGTYTALTYTQSKTFKTFKAAKKWLEKRGYDANGNRI